MRKYITGEIFIVLSAMCYGILPILNTFVLKEGVSVYSLLFGRFFLAGTMFFMLMIIMKISPKISRKDLFILFLQGGLYYQGISFCYASAIKYVSVSLAALLMYTYPVFIMLYVWLIKKQKQSTSSIISLFISIIGISLIVGTSFGQINTAGILLGVGSSIAYMIYVLASANTARQMSPIVSTFYISISASITILILGFFMGDLNFVFTPVSVSSILLIAIFPTACAVLFFLKGLKTVSESKAAVIAMLEPLFAIVFAAIILGQSMTIMQIIGSVVLVSGILGIMGLYQKRESVK